MEGAGCAHNAGTDNHHISLFAQCHTCSPFPTDSGVRSLITLLRCTQSSRCRFINHVEMRRSHYLLLATRVANDHTIVAFRRFERDVAVDDIMQHHRYRAYEGVAIAASSGRIELDAIAWSNVIYSLWLRVNAIVHQVFARRAVAAAFKSVGGEVRAVNQGRDAPGGADRRANLRPLAQAATKGTGATRIGAQFAQVLHQWRQAFHHLGWYTRHAAGETGAIQTIFRRARACATALKEAKVKVFLPIRPLAMQDGDPDGVGSAVCCCWMCAGATPDCSS